MKKKKIFKNNRPRGKIVRGVIRGNSRGFGFLVSDGEEWFIPPSGMGDAMHGDTVEAEIVGDHGEVKRIILRGCNEMTGIYVRGIKSKVISKDGFYRDVSVIGGAYAETGDMVVVRLSFKDRRKGEIIKNLGKAGTLKADIAVVLDSLKINDFTIRTLNEAEESCKNNISCGREDLTYQPCFTIDGEDSKDFDDAVYAERHNGGFKLWVHIADVSHFVPLYGHVDKEAFRRGNSFYYGESVIPMLPECLSNGVCSLNENEDRLTLSVEMDISSLGEITGGRIFESTIRSKKRMTYEKVDETLGGVYDGYSQFKDTLLTIKELRDALKSRRDEMGNIDFDIPEPRFVFKNGVVSSVKRANRLISHSMIEECMMAANTFVATCFLNKKVPFVYRVHEPPSQEKLETLNEYLSAMNFKPVNGDSKSIANLLSSAADKKTAISMMTLRSMSKAKYSARHGEHFGLAIENYCHFTSPIRRYADLTIHRIIKDSLSGKDLVKYEALVKEVADKASEREALSDKAERETDELYIADYMSRFIGKRFDGTVSGVTERGIFVLLSNTAEGAVKTEGSYIYDERTVSATLNGKRYALGDKINVKLTEASCGKLIFEL